jgi:PAS domain S-box-containing protein
MLKGGGSCLAVAPGQSFPQQASPPQGSRKLRSIKAVPMVKHIQLLEHRIAKYREYFERSQRWIELSTSWLVRNGRQQPCPHPSSVPSDDEHAERNQPTKARRSALQPSAIPALCVVSHSIVRALDGTIRFWSDGAEDMYGWNREEAIGRSSHELLRTQFPIPLGEINQILRRDGQWAGELVHTHKSGREMKVWSQWALIGDETGTANGTLQINIDITALEAVHGQLSSGGLREREVMSVFAHEIRNPLAAISTANAILRKLETGEPRIYRVRAIIERQIEHLKRLADDLLDHERICQGKLDLRPQRVQLSTLLHGSTELVQAKIDARRHNLTTSLPPEEIWLSGDSTRLIQAIANLLDNAAKYTPDGGTISLAAHSTGEYVEIRVRDNGIGIAPEELPRIFDLYSQSEDENQRSCGDGLGIGLCMAATLRPSAQAATKAASSSCNFP